MSILNEMNEQTPEKTPMQNNENFAGLSGTPKTMFLFGAASGAGTVALLVLAFGMVALTNGTGLSFAGMKDTNAAAIVADTNPTADANAAAAAAAPAADVPAVTADDHILGAENASVTLIEYSDFECPYCSKHTPTINQLLADYPNDVRVIYRHFPLSFHPQAENAAIASECAANQGKFWEMHDKLFAYNEAGTLNVANMKQAAVDLGLDAAIFNTCLDNKETLAEVTADYQGGITAGVGGTPATFVNGQIVEGAVPVATFKQIVESLIAS